MDFLRDHASVLPLACRGIARPAADVALDRGNENPPIEALHRLIDRQSHGESGARIALTRYFDAAAVGIDNGLADGQPQTVSSFGPRARFVGAVKALEDVRQVFGGDADSGVRDGE